MGDDVDAKQFIKRNVQEIQRNRLINEDLQLTL